MTVRPGRDERIPPLSIPNYRSHPIVMLLGEQMIVFRLDTHASASPRCVAWVPSGGRCPFVLPGCGTVTVHVVGTDATVEATTSSLSAECFLRQRCPDHVGEDGEDTVSPVWEPFDPERHADALHYTVPRWSPRGVWTPPVLGRKQHVSILHERDCMAGDHVPRAGRRG